MKKKWIYALVSSVLIVIVVGAVWAINRRSSGDESQKFVAVERGDLQVTILASGTVQPENRLEIKPAVSGRVEEVLVQEGDRVRKGQILAWMSSTERAAMLDAARAQGAEELKRWQEFYKPTPIMAPLNGTLISRAVEPGQTVATSDPILVMSDRLTVKAQVDETDLAQVKLRQQAVITLDAYPDREIPATVDQIAFEAKTVNNVTTYVVDVLPEKAPDYMRSGMTANVTFDVQSREGVLLVPAEAVKFNKGQPTVQVKVPNQDKPKETSLKLGLSDGKQMEVLEGLSEGQQVLIPTVQAKEKGGANPFMPAMRGRRR